jgi:Immunoglobulin-like domain of bacterial spore germination
MNKKTIAFFTATILAGSAVAGVMNTSWANQASGQAQQQVSTKEATKQQMFRNIKLSEPAILYTLKGEASVFEGTYHYVVKQGKRLITKGFGTASLGGPEWGTFSQAILVPANKISGNEPLTLEMFEVDQESGKVVNQLTVPLNESGDIKPNKVFRNMKLSTSSVVYTVTGEASVFEGTYQYKVKQGEQIVAKGFGTAEMGAPEWGAFTQEIVIPTDKLSKDVPRALELYEIDAESGDEVNKIVIPLASLPTEDSQQAFRDVKLEESMVTYKVTGQASVFEGTYQYVVKQGNQEIATGFGTASMGGPEWGTFTQHISIPASKLSADQPLMLELFEVDQESGAIMNKMVMPLK